MGMRSLPAQFGGCLPNRADGFPVPILCTVPRHLWPLAPHRAPFHLSTSVVVHYPLVAEPLGACPLTVACASLVRMANESAESTGMQDALATLARHCGEERARDIGRCVVAPRALR